MAVYKNVASQKLAVFAYDSTDGLPVTGNAANITAQISLDGGTTAATNDVNPTELDATDAPGIYIFDLTQAETNADLIVVAPVSATADVELDPSIIYTTPGTNAGVLSLLAAVTHTGAVIPTVNSLAANAITSASITSSAITEAKIASATITASKFAPNAIDSAVIATGAITAGKFAAGAIDAAAIATDAIDADALAADAIAEINATVDTALADIHLDHLLAADYDPASKPGAPTALFNELIENNAGVSRYTAGALAQAPTGGSAPTVGQIADAVWTEVLSPHISAGNAAEALDAAGTAGDPWVTALPGAYGAGTAGKIIGDNLNATVSSRATQTSVDDVPTNAEFNARTLAAADYATASLLATVAGYLDTEISAILADTNELQTDWANGGRLDLLIDAIKARTDVVIVAGVSYRYVQDAQVSTTNVEVTITEA